jgi:NAD(P)-dependent dehydrogenase (short-subunit alcohol dehydrogenase family)
VLVTGGARGIGREVALIAASEGAKVLVNDLGGGQRGGDEGEAGPAEEVAAEIRAKGGKAVSNSRSVTDYDAVVDMREQALRDLGGLHAVINPAGILRDAMFHKMTGEDWDAVVNVHLRGSFNVCRATIEHFRDQRDGAYVLFSSTSGLIGNVGQTNYGAAKMGIAGLSRILALEGLARNVRSNTLAPVAWTRMLASVPIRDEEHARRRQEMERAISAAAPARLAVALASPLAKGTTGQIFGVQGNDISIFSQPRTIDFRENPDGWTIGSILSDCLPALAPNYTPIDRPMGNITRPPEP